MEVNSTIVHTPPRAAATVVLLRDGAQGLEVFLVRRAAQSTVLGGVHVFPGGKLDDTDLALAHQLRADLDHAALAARLAEPELAPAVAASLFVAAMREAFEECGVLFAHTGETPARARAQPAGPEPTRTGLPTTPSGVNNPGFADQVRFAHRCLTASALHPWTRWITPRQPSVMHTRFDTRFFLAALPAGQTAVHDNHEATASAWLTPQAALQRYWHNEIEMAPPQIMSLVQLARHATMASALSQARLRPPPVIEPQPFDQNGMRVICYPGDPRHPQPQAAMPGPTRLVFRNRRFEPEHGGLAALLPPG
jgi:8-oxo-dGTP pyrophosphatase MutT (NUDIX family)